MKRILALALAATTVAVGLTACQSAPVADPVGKSLPVGVISYPERVDPTPRTVVVEHVVTERVEVPVVETVTETVTETVEVPDPDAYADGYAAARAEFEVPDDYWADWWEDGRDSGYSTATVDFGTALTTPCAQEDSTNCYWDAAAMGNGTGTSFVNVNGTTYPLPAQ